MDTNRIKCLLIDDDPDDRELFEEALSKFDYDFTLVKTASAVEALKVLKDKFIPHFIFLDLNMPGMKGKECLKKIKELLDIEESKIIIYSNLSVLKDLDELMRMGAKGYITKTSNFKELKQVLFNHMFGGLQAN